MEKGTSGMKPALAKNGDPKVIVWKGYKLKETYSTSRTCHYYLNLGQFRIQLQHLSKVKWHTEMHVYGLSTMETRVCEDLQEVNDLLNYCYTGLLSLAKDAVKELEDQIGISSDEE